MQQNSFLTRLIISFSRFVGSASKQLHLGAGSTIPGAVALRLDKHILEKMVSRSPNLRVIVVSGTNGKTTTGSILEKILKSAGYKTLTNFSGANLMTGIASTLMGAIKKDGSIDADIAIFEVDENVLPALLSVVPVDYIVLLNLFRDQLDRYGEIDTIIKRWEQAFAHVKHSTLVLNADDPRIAYIGETGIHKVVYFGVNEEQDAKDPGVADSHYCPRCGNQLSYEKIFFSHLGIYECSQCGFKRPTPAIPDVPYPLAGLYNKYNTNAAIAVATAIGVDTASVIQGLQQVRAVFGRQEVIHYKDKKAHIFLSKNPTSFNQSLRTIMGLGAKKLLIVLNDRIPDGRDISWIWDTAIEEAAANLDAVIVSGDRCYDMALRIKYATDHHPSPVALYIEEDLREAVEKGFEIVSLEEPLYVLPTYSAMLEVRKILTGKKI